MGLWTNQSKFCARSYLGCLHSSLKQPYFEAGMDMVIFELKKGLFSKHMPHTGIRNMNMCMGHASDSLSDLPSGPSHQVRVLFVQPRSRRSSRPVCWRSFGTSGCSTSACCTTRRRRRQRTSTTLGRAPSKRSPWRRPGASKKRVPQGYGCGYGSKSKSYLQ